ncbi:MAG: flagellar brake protein [Eubacteriales bacterium]|nr:flagellar brake protein [Eubacteriales bacterium]
MSEIGIRAGDKLEIKVQSKDGKEHSYTTHVAKTMNETLMFVHAPIFAGRVVKLAADDKYEFSFFAQDGFYRAKGTVSDHYFINNEDTLVRLEVYEYVHIQKRGLFRLDVDLDFTYSRLADSEGSEGDMPVYKGTVKNISGGGLSCESDVLLTKEEHILCRLTLLKQLVTVEGRVLDVRQLQDDEKKQDVYAYRIVFVDIESRAQDKIIQYILAKQREALTNHI